MKQLSCDEMASKIIFPNHLLIIAWKLSKYRVISGPYFRAFGLNISPKAGKYGPEITPYLDTFHAVDNFYVFSELKPLQFMRSINLNKGFFVKKQEITLIATQHNLISKSLYCKDFICRFILTSKNGRT